MVSGHDWSLRQRGTKTPDIRRSSEPTGEPCTVPNCTAFAMLSIVSTVFSGFRKYWTSVSGESFSICGAAIETARLFVTGSMYAKSRRVAVDTTNSAIVSSCSGSHSSVSACRWTFALTHATHSGSAEASAGASSSAGATSAPTGSSASPIRCCATNKAVRRLNDVGPRFCRYGW